MLYAGVVEQRLLLKLLQLLGVEAEGVRPEVGARVDEGRAQRFWKSGRCIIFPSVRHARQVTRWLRNIFSFSLFQRSIAEGKEGKEGGGEEGDYKVIYQVNQSWTPAAMADISIEAWKLI